MHKLLTYIILVCSLEHGLASHLVQEEKQVDFSSRHNFTGGIGFVISPKDSPEYTDYVNKFSAKSYTFKFPDDAPCLTLVPFLVTKEMSAFKTLLGLPKTGPFAPPEDFLRYFVKDYGTYYLRNTNISADIRADALECAGTFYINRQEYDFAFNFYDHVRTIGKLSPDGLLNYIIHSLLERSSDSASVTKAWHMVQEWQKQFKGGPVVSRIYSTDIRSNPEIAYLIKVYKLLFETLTNYPHYHCILEEIMDFRMKEGTSPIVNVCILDSFNLMLESTAFASHRVGQPVKAASNDYEKVIQKNLIRQNIEFLKSDQLFQDMVTENTKSILQKDDSIRSFLKDRLKESFDPQNITLNQYLYWTRKIINSRRQDLLAYSGKNLFVIERINDIDNVELEKIIIEVLEKIVNKCKYLI